MTPTNDDQPTLGEVVRRLDDTVKQVTGLVDRLEKRDRYVEEHFVRNAVWLEARKADQMMVANLHQDIGALNKGRENDTNFRRQIILAVIGAFAAGVVAIFIALAGLR